MTVVENTKNSENSCSSSVTLYYINSLGGKMGYVNAQDSSPSSQAYPCYSGQVRLP